MTDTPYPGSELRHRLERVEHDVELVEQRLAEGAELMVRLDERVQVITGELRGVRRALWALLATLSLTSVSVLASVLVP